MLQAELLLHIPPLTTVWSCSCCGQLIFATQILTSTVIHSLMPDANSRSDPTFITHQRDEIMSFLMGPEVSDYTSEVSGSSESTHFSSELEDESTHFSSELEDELSSPEGDSLSLFSEFVDSLGDE